MITGLFLYTSNPEKTIHFYRDILGMNFLGEKEIANQQQYHFSYDEKEASLIFVYNPDFKKVFIQNEGYWKIALSVKDVEIARQKLIEKGISVGSAFQVPDVAFLCHFKDPEGYTIELIQHLFEKNYTPQLYNNNYTLGSKTVFLLVTYRVKDAVKSVAFYKKLGMRLLSKQAVDSRGFCLYFLAFTDEKLPNEDVEALENREWLWQRNYTILELQHIYGTETITDFSYNTSNESGFLGMNVSTSNTLKDIDGYTLKYN